MLQMIPRLVAFDEAGKAVAAGTNANHHANCRKVIIDLPTDHYDFLGPINPVGKTESEIRAEVASAVHFSLIFANKTPL